MPYLVTHLRVFFFNLTATTAIYTLSLHDALPICFAGIPGHTGRHLHNCNARLLDQVADRKSTRLNSSHTVISYAVFCLKKKNAFRSDMHVDHYRRLLWSYHLMTL